VVLQSLGRGRQSANQIQPPQPARALLRCFAGLAVPEGARTLGVCCRGRPNGWAPTPAPGCTRKKSWATSPKTIREY